MTDLFCGGANGSIGVGEQFTSAMTITEAHPMLGPGLIADFNPLHVNKSYARQSRYGSRILHGVITSAILGGPVGMIFAGAVLVYLEHNARFLAPVRIGDTLTLRWTVTGKIDKPARNAAIVALDGGAINQHGVTVAEANGKMLVSC